MRRHKLKLQLVAISSIVSQVRHTPALRPALQSFYTSLLQLTDRMVEHKITKVCIIIRGYNLPFTTNGKTRKTTGYIDPQTVYVHMYIPLSTAGKMNIIAGDFDTACRLLHKPQTVLFVKGRVLTIDISQDNR